MPPLPITFDEETTMLIDSAKRIQADLKEVQLPRLRACSGPWSVQQTFAAEIRDDLDVLSKKVEALDLLVWDQKVERNKRELNSVVEQFKESLVSLRQESRAALLASKKIIDSQSRSRREELLRFSAVTEQKTSEKTTDDALMRAHNDVTEALRRTINLMQGELERSVLSSQILESSTASLRSTSSVHDTLTDLMGSSKQLITALEKSDWLDRMLIISAFVFFMLVVLFIAKQRILDRSLRIAFWWTRFLPDFSGDEKLLSTMSTLSTTVASSKATVISETVVPTSIATTTTDSVFSALPSPSTTQGDSVDGFSTLNSDSILATPSVVVSSSIPSEPIHVEL
ncbi:hypothetical protein AMATHDRAFT_146616 [Amanita thiersii Skay4041]|uniref:Sec20 C-terminal domain-containing protein n=1 Tax=Amanita thiersii Skay4041 TaxID=703135 RepID=A0A2A9NKN1_9AGAR|nr:hypothetical protein AMATHDRAFT_146616 [Amanita thiersii Skay4041]